MSEKFKVILIDDEENILELYESFVPEDKFESHSFVNPEEALKFIAENALSIALIISDFKMPELNGFEVREKLLEQDLDIPFAMVTGFYDKEMAAKGMKLRICRFVEKPVDEAQIVEILEKEAAERIESLLEDREMISEFLQETQPMLEEIEELILSLEDDPHDVKAVNTYFRLLHTIKGTSSCLGLTEIAGYAHEYEDLITCVKDNKINVNRKVIDVLLVGLDQLKELYLLASNFRPFPVDLDERAKVFSQDFSSEESETEQSSNVEGASVSEAANELRKEKPKDKDEKVTVSEGLLAHFLEMSGELTVIRNSIFKTLSRVQEKLPGDPNMEQLGESMLEMQKVSAILQNQISEMKKVSIETVYRPMRRVVRDSCSVLDKEIEFEIKGDNLQVDTTVAKLLNGALVHLLRNGVDHGIESKEERIKAGKNEVGSLILNSYETGEDIVVEIIDDGKGLNKEVLKAKALEKGLFNETQLNQMSDQKIYSIIFESGFSTNSVVTSVSGRGVGMDMVRSSIEEFGGRIIIDSELGRGSKFLLIIPIPRSILIIKSLIVCALNNKFNIPLDDVDEVVLFDASKQEQQIYRSNGSLILKHHNILCPLVDLGETLSLGQVVETDHFDMQNIVIVKGEGFRYGILVDEIEDIEEIVVKKLSDHFSIQEYLGTTFADDGALSMIIDCKGVANRYGIENLTEDVSGDYLLNKKVEEEIHEFMRFSLSKMPNCALPLDNVFRLEEMNSKDIQFTGEKGLIRYRGHSLPLVFIENLLGMTEKTLEDIAAEDVALSVLVVSYDDKLYGAIIEELQDIAVSEQAVDSTFSDRDGLLGTVTIDEKIISVIDIPSLVSVGRGTLSFNNMEQFSESNKSNEEKAA